jgi:hypothetical protein
VYDLSPTVAEYLVLQGFAQVEMRTASRGTRPDQRTHPR